MNTSDEALAKSENSKIETKSSQLEMDSKILSLDTKSPTESTDGSTKSKSSADSVDTMSSITGRKTKSIVGSPLPTISEPSSVQTFNSHQTIIQSPK